MSAALGGGARRCVYTVITGGYERLNEQPQAAGSAVPFICFTDDPDCRSESWQVRRFRPVLPGDAVRSQREGKLRPYLLLPEFDQSLYIDNSILLKQPPEALFAAADMASGLCLPAHSFRDTLLDEFTAVLNDRLDDPLRVAEQMEHYLAFCPDVLSARPNWTAILLRDHANPRVRTAMEIWLAQVYRYSRRDQLSAPVALHMAGLRAGTLEIDNHESAFHSWPHIGTRQAERRLWQAPETVFSAVALRAELAAAQRREAELRAERDALLNATSWGPLRALVRRVKG